MDFLSRLLLTVLWAVLTGVVPLVVAEAQLSPGKLQEGHLKLEGLSRCTQCHALGKGIESERCLACHEPLRERLEAARGLHARSGYETCILCHSDHQGRDYAMIRWPGEQSEFPHEQVDFELRQAHARLGCRECHQARHITNPDPLTRHGKDLARTFFGLGTECTSCHEDKHEATLGPDCSRCHDEDLWKPAPRFEHEFTKYPLTGKHSDVLCKKCHETAPLFPLPAFGQCSDCHKDPHVGDLGADCVRCHQTTGWAEILIGELDHNTTRFPLRGAHAKVTCARCHVSGRPVKDQLSCAQCHKDPHGSVFASVSGRRTDCSQCHGEDRFVPSTYGTTRHLESRYPLTGAHRAVPCADCHRPGAKESVYRWVSLDCASCHSDPHAGSFSPVGGGTNICATCHQSESWSRVTFVHDESGHVQRGAHLTADCLDCHSAAVREELRFWETATVAPLLGPLAVLTAKESPASEFEAWNEFREQVRLERGRVREQARVQGRTDRGFVREQSAGLNASLAVLRLDDAPRSCDGCHLDPHAKQFVHLRTGATSSETDTNEELCLRCHSMEAWTVESFDHESSARFSLEGGHEKVTCVECHRREADGRQRFRPLGRDCRDCHAATPSEWVR